MPAQHALSALKITSVEARIWALNALKTHQKTPALELVEHLGYIQIDSISVIERAHHHVLWTRNPGYQLSELNHLLGSRKVFEYWGHAASYLPMKDYRFYQPRMKRFVEQSNWGKKRLETHGHLLPDILSRIREEGPLKAKDFKGTPRKNSGWWDWKPAKVALELLYWQGEIMVCRREGVQKVYDLKSRFLPQMDQTLPTPKELAEFCVYRAIQAHGVISEAQILKHLPLSSRTDIKACLKKEVASDRVQLVSIEGLSDTYYAMDEPLLEPLPTEVALLSPFDNGVIQRQRLKDVFDFHYIFEAYVPQAKRQHGYFTLPVLWGNQFVGRCDLKADRKTKTLIIQHLFFEPNFDTDCLQAVAEKLKGFASFCGCEHVVFAESVIQESKDLLSAFI